MPAIIGHTLKDIGNGSDIILNVVIYQQKERKKLLICKLFSNITWTLHYGMAGNLSRAAVGAIGIAREGTVLTIEDRKMD